MSTAAPKAAGTRTRPSRASTPPPLKKGATDRDKDEDKDETEEPSPNNVEVVNDPSSDERPDSQEENTICGFHPDAVKATAVVPIAILVPVCIALGPLRDPTEAATKVVRNAWGQFSGPVESWLEANANFTVAFAAFITFAPLMYFVMAKALQAVGCQCLIVVRKVEGGAAESMRTSLEVERPADGFHPDVLKAIALFPAVGFVLLCIAVGPLRVPSEALATFVRSSWGLFSGPVTSWLETNSNHALILAALITFVPQVLFIAAHALQVAGLVGLAKSPSEVEQDNPGKAKEEPTPEPTIFGLHHDVVKVLAFMPALVFILVCVAVGPLRSRSEALVGLVRGLWLQLSGPIESWLSYNASIMVALGAATTLAPLMYFICAKSLQAAGDLQHLTMSQKIVLGIPVLIAICTFQITEGAVWTHAMVQNYWAGVSGPVENFLVRNADKIVLGSSFLCISPLIIVAASLVLSIFGYKVSIDLKPLGTGATSSTETHA